MRWFPLRSWGGGGVAGVGSGDSFVWRLLQGCLHVRSNKWCPADFTTELVCQQAFPTCACVRSRQDNDPSHARTSRLLSYTGCNNHASTVRLAGLQDPYLCVCLCGGGGDRWRGGGGQNMEGHQHESVDSAHNGFAGHTAFGCKAAKRSGSLELAPGQACIRRGGGGRYPPV